jgi:hypothetical protein
MNSLCVSSRRFVGIAVISVFFAASVYATSAIAQITSPSGPQGQENRNPTMGLQPDAATSAVHESHRPQAKDAKGKTRGATVKKSDKTEGAGGFDNGLYGTGRR